MGAIAMLLVLFDTRATKGRALPLWAKTIVIFGAAVLLGIGEGLKVIGYALIGAAVVIVAGRLIS